MTDPCGTLQKAFTTDTFATSPATYLRCLAGMWLSRYWPYAALPLAAASAIAVITYDPRWAIAALMLLMLLMPMGATWLYYYYMLAPEARLAVMPKRIAYDPVHGLTATYTDLPAEHIAPHRIAAMTEWRRTHLAVILAGQPRLGFILIPLHAIHTAP